MAILPMSSSIKLHSNIPIPKSSLVIKSISNLSNVAPPPTNLLQLINNPSGSVADQTPIKNPGEFNWKNRFSGEKESGFILIQRLEAVGERIRELEIEKFMNRMKGTELSYEQSTLVEKMSREIVCRFLEKPIKFLRSSDGDLEDKLKELNLLVGILEESFPMKEKIQIH